MVSCYRHGPGFVALVQGKKKACSVIDIEMGFEHFLHIMKFFAVKIMIDLHTSHINQLCALKFGLSENCQRLIDRSGKNSFPLNI